MTAANCAGDLVYLYVNGVQDIGTEGVNFSCSTTDAACATSLAAWIDGKTGLAASAATNVVSVTRAPSEPGVASLTLRTSDTSCAVITEGSDFGVAIVGNSVTIGPSRQALYNLAGFANPRGLSISATNDLKFNSSAFTAITGVNARFMTLSASGDLLLNAGGGGIGNTQAGVVGFGSGDTATVNGPPDRAVVSFDVDGNIFGNSDNAIIAGGYKKLMLRGQVGGGTSISDFLVANFANCAGNFARVVTTKYDGTQVTTTLTEGVTWTAATSNAITGTSLGYALATVPGIRVRSDSTGTRERILVDPRMRNIVLSTDDATCLTVTNGANYPVDIFGGAGGGLEIGSGAIMSYHLSGTASLNYGATGGQTCDDLTIAITAAADATNAADGDTVTIGVPVALATTDAFSSFTGFVSAGGVVTVRRCCASAAACSNPAAATVRADVWKH
jgi:hypothetical protein